jgi:hypothetical protein
MVLRPGSEPRDAGEPPDYRHDHLIEDPRQWGWHGEWGNGARLAGMIVAVILLLMLTATNYQFEYHLTLILLAAAVITVLLIDRGRRRHRWPRR